VERSEGPSALLCGLSSPFKRRLSNEVDLGNSCLWQPVHKLPVTRPAFPELRNMLGFSLDKITRSPI